MVLGPLLLGVMMAAPAQLIVNVEPSLTVEEVSAYDDVRGHPGLFQTGEVVPISVLVACHGKVVLHCRGPRRFLGAETSDASVVEILRQPAPEKRGALLFSMNTVWLRANKPGKATVTFRADAGGKAKLAKLEVEVVSGLPLIAPHAATTWRKLREEHQEAWRELLAREAKAAARREAREAREATRKAHRKQTRAAVGDDTIDWGRCKRTKGPADDAVCVDCRTLTFCELQAPPGPSAEARARTVATDILELEPSSGARRLKTGRGELVIVRIDVKAFGLLSMGSDVGRRTRGPGAPGRGLHRRGGGALRPRLSALARRSGG